MTDTNVFVLAQIIKVAGYDPSKINDMIWEAGYRQPERTAEEAALITIDVFFHCNSLDMPTDFWPQTYDSVLQNELMKAVLEDYEITNEFDPVRTAKNVLKVGFEKVLT
jgi:hypothetical protein